MLGALTCRFSMGLLERKPDGIDWYRFRMYLFFLLPGAVLAGYFYPLERKELQIGYLAVLGAALVMVLWQMFDEGTDDGAQGEDEDKAAKAGREGEEEKKEQQTEDEESGWLMTLLGAAVLYSPVLVACGLGCYKAWPMVQKLV